MNEIQKGLLRPFPESRVSWRVGATNADKTKGIALAYIDARDVMDRLDAVCGVSGWQNKYSLSADGLLICDIAIKMNGEWVWKANGAGATDVEADKGKASDAFKRAAVLWGIGRYLYALDNNWVEIEPAGKSFKLKTTPSMPYWATPEGFDDQEVIDNIYNELVTRLKEFGATNTIAYFEALQADHEIKTAAWGKLSSRDRAALKKAHEATKGAK